MKFETDYENLVPRSNFDHEDPLYRMIYVFTLLNLSLRDVPDCKGDGVGCVDMTNPNG